MYKNRFFDTPLNTSLPSKTAYLTSLNFNESLTREMAEFSYDRIVKHRKIVMENINTLLGQNDLKNTLALSEQQFNEFKNKLIERGEKHDLSKFSDPEKIAYIYINWKHHSEKTLNIDYPCPVTIKQKVNEAIQHHFQNNSHHSDFFCYKPDNTRENNKEKIKALLKNMNDLDLLEMVADWMAVSQEYQTSCTDYAVKTIGDDKAKPFSEEQKIKIFKWISLFELEHQIQSNPVMQQKEKKTVTFNIN